MGAISHHLPNLLQEIPALQSVLASAGSEVSLTRKLIPRQNHSLFLSPSVLQNLHQKDLLIIQNNCPFVETPTLHVHTSLHILNIWQCLAYSPAGSQGLQCLCTTSKTSGHQEQTSAMPVSHGTLPAHIIFCRRALQTPCHVKKDTTHLSQRQSPDFPHSPRC